MKYWLKYEMNAEKTHPFSTSKDKKKKKNRDFEIAPNLHTLCKNHKWGFLLEALPVKTWSCLGPLFFYLQPRKLHATKTNFWKGYLIAFVAATGHYYVAKIQQVFCSE